MIENIRHIIFDLGGVLLNIDYNRTGQAFAALGIPDFHQMYSQLRQTPLFDDLEVGRIKKDAFVSALQQAAGIALSEADIIEAWNAMLLDFPLRRLQLLQQLRMHYDLILLSNTNEIHEAAFNSILTQAHGFSIGMLFDKVYLSHRIGMRKPDTVVFRHILEENGLNAAHTLFIDDSLPNIEAANTLGIQTIWMEKGMTIEEHIFLPKGSKG
jgi:glucose-1-phosphatase